MTTIVSFRGSTTRHWNPGEVVCVVQKQVLFWPLSTSVTGAVLQRLTAESPWIMMRRTIFWDLSEDLSNERYSLNSC